jgi:hypothetical protein
MLLLSTEQATCKKVGYHRREVEGMSPSGQDAFSRLPLPAQGAGEQELKRLIIISVSLCRSINWF